MHPKTFPVALARSLFLNDDLFGMVLDSLARAYPEQDCAARSLTSRRRCFWRHGFKSLEEAFAANLPAHVSDEVFRRFPNRVFETVKHPRDAPFTFESLVFPVLDFLREHFLMVRETGPVIRHERIEEYGALARSVDPALLAARHLLVEDRRRDRGRRDAARARFRRPLPRDNRVPPGSLIDNHIHLRGTAPAGAYLIAHLEEAGPEIDGGPRADADAARAMGLLRLLYGEVLRALDFPSRGEEDPSPGRIRQPDDGKYLAARLSQMACAAPPYPRPRHSLRAILYRGRAGRAETGPAALLSLAAGEWDAGRPESAWGCVIAAVLEGAAAGNAVPSVLDRRLALAFLLQASRIHAEIHGSRRAGLKSFVKTFGHKLREVTDEAKVGVDTAALRALRSADCDHAELRYDLKPSKIDPATFLLRLVARRTAVDLTGLNDLADMAGVFDPATAQFMTAETRFTKAVHEGCRSWHFGHHFIHEGDGASGTCGGKRGRNKVRGKHATGGDPMIPRRHAERRRELWVEATRLDEWFGAIYGSRPLSSLIAYLPDLPPHLRARLQMGPMGRSLRIDPRALLRTLDAAGDENLTPPEVYAPAVRFLRRERSCEPPHPARTPGRRRPLQLAFHAGEDFRHPVSGMRRIDETIRFLRYRAGDRLGHALALGIRPRDWMRRMPEAAIDRHSHLDNLVWLWRRCRDLIGLHPDAAGYIARYEIRAMKEAVEIYGSSCLLDRTKFPLSMDALHQAWKLRGDCPESLLSTRRLTLAGVKDPRIPSMRPASSREKSEGWTALEIYRAYHHCPRVREKGEEIVILRHEPTLPAHCGDKYEKVRWIGIDDQELDLWEAVQDLLLDRLAEMGVVIEANPSSNIQIGVEDSIRDHPVFRWNPPDPDSLTPGGIHNRFGVRRGPNRVCINSDDPGIFASPLRDEYESLRRHALSIRVSPTAADRWLDELRRVGREVFEANHHDPIIPFQSTRHPPRPAARAPS